MATGKIGRGEQGDVYTVSGLECSFPLRPGHQEGMAAAVGHP